MTDENARPSYFLCYAGEDNSLMTDFKDRFEQHNNIDEKNLFYDGTPYSQNMHARFRDFALNCHVAILLVNARFTCLDSYATKYEMPILSERQKNGDVCVVGIFFSDVEVSEWNKKGDVYFFQLRNDKLPNTRRTDENGQKYNNQHAVYEQIKTQDRNTYHKELSLWIKKLLKNKSKKITPSENDGNNFIIRNTEIKNENPLTINSSAEDIKNTPLFSIEQNLRAMPDNYFKKNGFEQPSDQQSLYVQSYLMLQGGKLRKLGEDFKKIDPELDDFISPIKLMSDDLTKRCVQVQNLLEKSICSDKSLNKALRYTRMHLDILDNHLHQLILDSSTTKKKELKTEILLPLSEQTNKLCEQIGGFLDEYLKPSLN